MYFRDCFSVTFLGSFLADKITQEDIESILQKFTGNIMQVPPL